MKVNLSHFKGDNLPVESISWDACRTFIKTLNDMNLHLETFRLPTEAEWEYSCRAETTAVFYWGEDSNNSQIAVYAWYRTAATHDAGTKKPNAWGLYDMSGNVMECIFTH